MAISLSELTGASTSGNVLNEVNSYADFLDSVPRLVNKADPSGNTDAVQTVATKQPIALPLIDGEGYLFLSGVTGNYASIPNESSFNGLTDFVMEARGVTFKDWTSSVYNVLFAKWGAGGNNFIIRRFGTQINFYANINGAVKSLWFNHGLSNLATADIKFTRSGDNLTFSIDLGSGYTDTTSFIGSGAIDTGTSLLEFGARGLGVVDVMHGAIKGGRIWDNATQTGDPVLDVDFTSPRIPHGASEFTCETGQVVTVNTSGNNPAKVIKKPVLRFDGVNSSIRGWFTNNLTSGYMFAAFTVNGDGGGQWGRVFSVNLDGSGTDYDGAGAAFSLRSSSTTTLRLLVQSGDVSHLGMFDDANGDILHETKLSDDLSVLTKVNDANSTSVLHAGTIDSDRFNIGSNAGGSENSSIDLEYLALFPATLTDSQADQVRNFINNRNKVFTLIDSQGYYFFDGAATDDGQVFTGSGSWNGRIVGSDNGDSDKYISQNTLDDRPTTDGYKITFADNTDHFDIPSTTQAGWQIVGTSRGTFAYKVNDRAITELNLLGNLGSTSFRQTGDLYGIILLPESATNRDIEEARKLLIDRGASDGTTASSLNVYFYGRRDIVDFKAIDFSSATSLRFTWWYVDGITSFPELDLSNVTDCYAAWESARGLVSFNTTDLKNCSDFSYAWGDTHALQQFPQNAKLGTEVTGSVYFARAWQQSGLTSFSTPLPTATNTYHTWYGCASLTSFSSELPSATNVSYAWKDCSSLTSFTTTDIKNCSNFSDAWYSCASLEQFPQDALLGTETTGGAGFYQAWRFSGLKSFSTPMPKAVSCLASWMNCSSLTDFSTDVFTNWNPPTIDNFCFNNAWSGCTSLKVTSVENILTSIEASGKWATTNGLQGGTALTNPEITISYDVSTGSLTAATLSAIETLNGRGWSVNINNEIIVPNILQLQPAAAYSLRSFDADADPTVVNVRRSSDGSLSDFTASQVSDGTLTDWVNNVVTISPTLNNGGFEDGATGWTLGSATTIDSTISHSGSNSAKLNVVGGAYTFLQRAVSPLEVGKEVTVGFWAKTSDASKALNVSLGVSTHLINFTTTDWEYKEITRVIYTNTTMIFARSGSGDFTIHIDDITVTNLTADGYVTTFYDQSSNGNDSTQSIASQQPLIVENGVLVTENGEAALDFNRSRLTLDSNIFAEQLEVAVVNHLDEDATTYYQRLIYLTNGSDDDFMIVKAPTDEGNALLLRCNSTENALTSVNFGDDVINNQNLIYVTSNTSSDLYTASVDGVEKSSAGTVPLGSGNFSQSMIGIRDDLLIGTYAFGTIQEIVIFDTDQSVQRTGIEKNINDHYSIY